MAAAISLLALSPASATSYATYDILFGSPTGLVTGTITTDCDSCVIGPSDIIFWSFTGNDGVNIPQSIASTNPNAVIWGAGVSLLSATPTGIFYNFASPVNDAYFCFCITGPTINESHQFLLLYTNQVANTQDYYFLFIPIGRSGLLPEAMDFDLSESSVLQLGILVSEVTITPLPAALPLFATGLGAMGLFGWRRKRKAQAVA